MYSIDPGVTAPRLLAKLVADDGAEGDRYGFSVAVSDSGFVVVGAYGDDDNGVDSGSAYCYRANATGTPRLLAKLVAPDGAAGDLFGTSVAVSGDGVVSVGAHKNVDKEIRSGSVYLYRIGSSGTTPELVAKIVPDDGAADDGFGRSIAMGGDGLVVVGADSRNEEGSRSGAAYVFRVGASGTKPELVTKLVPDDGQAVDQFGISVSIGMDGVVAIGAYLDDDKGTNSGSAYVFQPVHWSY